ncbi:hypothetical protein [Desulfonatronovibrio magnus]|uniref:hypothetical protein n=1 Tax=Desulfonatronovibrio magnus TaxID=698827 RepID=UPI0005EBB816|nr:hypothetical protein [Desulfonatronovibrio magnus]
MNKLTYFSEDIVDETLKEAADNFFGKRRKIDSELELLDKHIRQLQQKAQTVERSISRLNYLLPGNDMVKAFWAKLGLKDSLYSAVSADWSGDAILPWAMTLKSKYRKTVLIFYSDLQKLVHDYLHGKYIDDPEVKGKKVMTCNLLHLKEWVEDLNKEIDNINCSNRPDDVMAFTRRINVSESSKRESVGSGLEYTYDQELCFQPVDFDKFGLPEYPELKKVQEVQEKISDFCNITFSDNKELIKNVLKKIS